MPWSPGDLWCSTSKLQAHFIQHVRFLYGQIFRNCPRKGPFVSTLIYICIDESNKSLTLFKASDSEMLQKNIGDDAHSLINFNVLTCPTLTLCVLFFLGWISPGPPKPRWAPWVDSCWPPGSYETCGRERRPWKFFITSKGRCARTKQEKRE